MGEKEKYIEAIVVFRITPADPSEFDWDKIDEDVIHDQYREFLDEYCPTDMSISIDQDADGDLGPRVDLESDPYTVDIEIKEMM